LTKFVIRVSAFGASLNLTLFSLAKSKNQYTSAICLHILVLQCQVNLATAMAGVVEEIPKILEYSVHNCSSYLSTYIPE
jgi:hypothetical protein